MENPWCKESLVSCKERPADADYPFYSPKPLTNAGGTEHIQSHMVCRKSCGAHCCTHVMTSLS